MNSNIILGVDIGGTHITSALVDVTSGKILDQSSFRQKINAVADAPEIIDAWCGVINKSLDSGEHSGRIAIAMPGPFDYENGISYMKDMGKYDALYGLDIRKLMIEKLDGRINDLHFINDAGCFLQGELSHGPAATYFRVIGFTLGTGFGSARGIGGVSQDADYWRHPFMKGICEDLFSSRWFVATYNQYSGKAITNVKDLIDKVDLGGPLLQVFDEFSMNLAAFLTQIHRNERFECIVLGGNIAKASALFLPQLRYHLASRAIEAPIIISAKGEDAALIGAACSIV